MKKTYYIPGALVAVAMLTVSCSSSSQPTAAPSEPTPIYAVSEVGGCAMMGPNCLTRLLWSDGTVTVYRQPLLELPLAGLAALTPAATAQVDPIVPQAVAAAVDEADVDLVIAGLPEGQCWACVDGVDYTLLIATADGEARINSSQTALDPTVPLIAELNNAAAAMGQNTDLPIVSR